MDSKGNAVVVRIESTVLGGQRQRIAKLDEASPNSNMTPQARQKINHWIRSTKEFDGMLDFDAVLRDPAHSNLVVVRPSPRSPWQCPSHRSACT
jgi:hypothetical protein